MTAAPAPHLDRRPGPSSADATDTDQAHHADHGWDTAHWFGLTLGVPFGWGCARHRCNPKHGSLVFVDRTRPRLQLTWTQADPTLDIQGVLDDYRRRTISSLAEATEPDTETDAGPPVAPAGRRGFRRHRKTDTPRKPNLDHAASQPHNITVTDNQHHAGWSWVTRRDHGRPTLTRMVRLDPGTNETDEREPGAHRAARLIEITLVHDDEKPTPAVEALAERSGVDASADRATHWRLLGLDVATPAGWTPTRLDAKPGDVSLRFVRHEPQNRKHPDTVTARRLGLTAAWFDGDLSGWLRRQHPDPRVTVRDAAHPDFTRAAVGDAKQPRWQRWVGRRQRIELLAAHDPDAETLCSLRAESLAKQPLALSGFRVAVFSPATG